MENYQRTSNSYLNTVINTFTQGLRALPTDVVTRVKNFLIEYLGKPEQPVPFGGRERDLRHLDEWLEDPQAPPYLLLAAQQAVENPHYFCTGANNYSSDVS
ncbi:hypothetical protein [Dictyobacter kobayashii]|uniref:Uncharacterized protein n=1 Tax=Dictyobacter kobayashii TaxID=2014872 RepID=A0A402AS53_9CHLR|nr:hypothetical protein [Dictyobacter kobayashii]GCE21926.1 hypothetical protein KDK_57260 [Dictyobacter kobayashii]